MPKVIVKCVYSKGGGGGHGGYMKYIATREDVETLPQDRRLMPVTDAQRELIGDLLREDPALKKSSEYGMYTKEKTVGSASEFISHALESTPELLNTEGYLRYMATRPGVEKISQAHGLFSSGGTPLDLGEEISKLEAHKGNVYSIIISLRREDAQRLGYNSAERWRSMIGANIDRIANEHRIPLTNLRWYGAFHNESHHPHVHMLLYSTQENSHAYLSKQGIDNLRQLFLSEIFKDEIHEVYDRQTEMRNRITNEMRSRFGKLTAEVSSGKCMSEEIQEKMTALALRLNDVSGKKQYGYLPQSVKKMVDETVELVAGDKRIAEMYELWYQAKCSVTQAYTDMLPEKLPLSKEPTFKPVRNALVREAAQLGMELQMYYGQGPAKPKNDPKEKQSDAPKLAAFCAALRFFDSICRTFESNCKQYHWEEDDDIDKKLRREIWAVKHGISLQM